MAHEPEQHSKKKRFILLGEDDIDDQEILEEIFESIDADLEIQVINTGKKLLNHIEELEDGHLPCLIVLDYNMPELNGAEILKKLQVDARVSKVPKIIWSTSNAPAYRELCMQLGARDYLVKPSKISVMTEMVKHMLSYCD